MLWYHNDMFKNLFAKKSDYHGIAVVLTVFSIFALLASFVLSVEKVHQLSDPNAKLSCSVNLVLNCASVMKTSEATIFLGIPNSFFGIIGFTAALTLSVVLLTGVKLPRWMLLWMQIGFAAGWGFALWLFFSSVYGIQILCPWCLIVTTSTTILFFAMLRMNLRENTFGLAKSQHKSIQKLLDKDYDKLIAAAVLVVLTALVFLKFGDSLFA
jgi:uncharacterized membrane protein